MRVGTFWGGGPPSQRGCAIVKAFQASVIRLIDRPARTASRRHRSINRNRAVASRPQLLQRLALDAGNSAAYQPARLAHLDDHHQSRDQIKRGQASAEIIELSHRATSIESYGR
jgi:hypothetical protein